jgi:hypothetical protein
VALYRLFLVWLLRAIAAVALVTTTWNYWQLRQVIAREPNLVERAGLSEPVFTFFAPAGALALLCLTLSEILSLLSRQRA